MSATLPAPPGPTVLGYAGFWWRTLAWLIDAILLSVLDGLLGRATGWRHLSPGWNGIAPGGDATVATVAFTDAAPPIAPASHLHWHGGLLDLVGTLAVMLYFVLLESSRWQGTVGKRVCRITVSDLSGRRIGIGRALVRYLGKILSGLLLGIGFLMVAWTHRKQGLHDKIAGTLVLRPRPADAVFAFAPPRG